MSFLSRLRAPILLLIIPLITLGYSLYTLFVVVPFGSQAWGDRVIQSWARVLCKLAGVRLHVTGLENLKKNGPYIFVSNHLSHYDIPVLYLALPFSFRMIAKEELFKIPLFGRAMDGLGFVAVNRESSESLKRVDSVAHRLKAGHSIWIAAEGTRFDGDGVGPFKSGAFYLALKSRNPIVPISIYGTRKVLPKNSLWVNSEQIYQDVFVHIGVPIPMDASQLSRGELRDAVRSLVVADFERLKTSNESLSLKTPDAFVGD